MTYAISGPNQYEATVADIGKEVDDSDYLCFGWAKKTDLIEHTTIVLALSNGKQFTFDRGPEGVKLHVFDGRIYDAVKLLTKEIDLRVKGLKEEMKSIVNKLYGMNVGKYKLFSDNCRDYVREAFNNVIAANPKVKPYLRQKVDVDKEMKGVTSNDAWKIAGLVLGIVAVGVGGSLLSKRDKNEKE